MSETVFKIILIILQSVLIIGISPLIIGYIRKIKARMQNRVGASVLQPYRDLFKLLRKDSVVSKHTSFVFLSVPYILMAIVVLIAILIPTFVLVSNNSSDIFTDNFVDIVAIIYLFGLYTFVLSLSAFDPATSFGGLGAARHYMFSIVCEPIIFLTFLVPALVANSTQISHMVSYSAANPTTTVVVLYGIALIAFFIALLAENARFPFDNPATHLELTMVHEAMILEYSGKHLGLVQFSAWIKLVLFFSIGSALFIPWGINYNDISILGILLGLVTYLVKIFVFATVVAVIESTIAKLRIFKLPSLLAFAALLVSVCVVYLIVFPK